MFPHIILVSALVIQFFYLLHLTGNADSDSTLGVTYVEIFADGDDICHAWIEYGNGEAQSAGPSRQVVLVEDDLKARLPADAKGKRIKILVHSAGSGVFEVQDVGRLVRSKTHIVKLPNGQPGFQGCKLGHSQQAGTQAQQVLLETAHIQTKLLTSVKIFHGFALDGIEFMYEDSTSQLFGKQGGSGDEFFFGEKTLASRSFSC